MSWYREIPQEVRHYKYVVTETRECWTGILGHRVTHEFWELHEDGLLRLLPGYAWDGMSWLARDTEDSMLGSGFHDALYQGMRLGLLPQSVKGQADELFARVNKKEGMHWFRCAYTWLGVHLFGRFYNRRKYGTWATAGAAVLLLLQMGAVQAADVEYVGGDLTAADGNRYYMSADVDLVDNDNFVVPTGATVEFDGADFVGVNTSGSGADWNWIYVESGGDLTLHNVTLDINMGVYVEAGGVLRVQDTTIRGAVAGRYWHAFESTGDAWVRFDRCVIRGAGTKRQILIGTGTHVEFHDCDIRYEGTGLNTIFSNTGQGTYVLERCTISHAGANPPIYVRGDSLITRGNIVTQDGGSYSMYVLNDGLVLTAEKNAYFGGTNATNINGDLTGASPDGGTGWFEDPQFTDAGVGDYSLGPQSPLIDQGYGTRTLDVQGNPGVFGAAVDVGAYERQSPPCYPPVASFYATPTSGWAPLEVDFVDTATNTPTAWKWYFGDGDSSSVQHPTHTYTTPGSYDVTLIASSSCGADTTVVADYVQPEDGSTIGVCCSDGGAGNPGVCTVTAQSACTAFWYGDETVCGPNPCPVSPDSTNVYQMKAGHPRYFTAEDLARRRALWNGGNPTGLAPELVILYTKVISEADEVLGMPDSTAKHNQNLAELAAAWVLTGSSAYSNKAESAFLDAATNGFSGPSNDNTEVAWDLFFNEFPDSLNIAIRDGLFALNGDYDDGIKVNRRQSGVYNLFGNEAYWGSAWAFVSFGVDLSTENQMAAYAIDECLRRFKGGPPEDVDNGFLTWFRECLGGQTPGFDFAKGPGYGEKYLADGLYPLAVLGRNSGVAPEIADSCQALWSAGGGSNYLALFLRGDQPKRYQRGFTNTFSFGERGWKVGAMESQLKQSPWASFGVLTAPNWSDYGATYLWASAALWINPDSVSVAPADRSSLEPFQLLGRDGDQPREPGENDYYDLAITSFGGSPWALDTEPNWLMVDAGMAAADNWTVFPRRLFMHGGTLIKNRLGWYEGGYDQYPDLFSTAWGASTVCVINNDDPTADEDYEACGPWFRSIDRPDHEDPAKPTSDWTADSTAAKYDMGNVIAAGAAALDDSVLVVYIKAVRPPGVYRDSLTWGVTKDEMHTVGVLPLKKNGGRAWVYARDIVERDTTSISPGEGVFTNFPIIHFPTIVGGAAVDTFDVPGTADDIVDYEGISYISVDRDTTVGVLSWDADLGELVSTGTTSTFTGHSRVTPTNVEFVRKVIGKETRFTMYDDVRDPVGSGHVGTYSDSSATDFNRFDLYEAGNGRLEFHGGNSTRADIQWVMESHSDADEPGGFTWASPTAITSGDAAGFYADSISVLILDDPTTGGPWSFTIPSGPRDVIVAGVEPGDYSIGAATATASGHSVIFRDIEGGALTLSSGGTPTGACCDLETCYVTTSATCAGAGHYYEGDGTTCSPNPCPPYGACCYGAGLCAFTLQGSCESVLSGTWQGDESDCDPNPCPQPDPTGACCASDGGCTVVTAASCSSGGGTYEGDDTTCSPNPCPQPDPTGACCASDGSCSVTTSSSCTGGGGTYEGDDTVCSPNPCPQPTGACCASDGSCSVTTSTLCLAAGSAYQGNNTTCSPNPCPQPPAEGEGACCDPSTFACTIQTPSACSVAGGIYRGNDTPCSPDPCAVYGACCDEDVCSITTQERCLTDARVWMGAGVDCSPNPCSVTAETGACCVVSSCSVVAPSTCGGLGGYYQGAGTVCSPNPCSIYGACCYGSSCVLSRVTPCLASLGAFGGEGSVCDPDPCTVTTATGACCTDFVCTITTHTACSGGIYQGNHTVCSPDPCDDYGACCLRDGSCAFVRVSVCLAASGSYLGEGSDCDPDPCP